MKKLMSILVSVALVMGLCPAFAYAGDALSAGASKDEAAQAQLIPQSKKGFVADRVYALIGNKYAMMVTEKNQVQTINIIDSNYNSKLKMVSKYTPNNYGGYDVTPQSAYQYAGMLAKGVVVKDKNSGKNGLVAFDGKKMIPCSYESLTENASGSYVVGTTTNANGTGAITLFAGATGKKITSVNVGKADSLYAYWSSGQNKINVSRYYYSGSKYNGFDEVYSFNGKKLNRVSSKKKSAGGYVFVIAPSIVERNGSYYTSKKSSGKLIKSLVGWHFAGYVSNGKYLFYYPNSKKAKIVNGKAKTLIPITASATQTQWGTVGSYVYSKTAYESAKAVETVYSAKGKKVMTLPKGQSLSALYTASNVRYYSRKTVSVKELGGAKTTGYRPVKYYDDNLKVLKNVHPALGSSIMELKGNQLYDSGCDAAGNLNSYTGYKQGSKDVVTATGAAVKFGKYTLSRPVRGSYGPISKSDLQFGSRNAYTAKTSSGKFGFASSAGKVSVPFKFDDVFCGSSGSLTLAKSSKVMVKKNGMWSFRSVS